MKPKLIVTVADLANALRLHGEQDKIMIGWDRTGGRLLLWALKGESRPDPKTDLIGVVGSHEI